MKDKTSKGMRILYISPTYFDSRSYLGGGERYAYELARGASDCAEVVFLSFGIKRESTWDGKLRVEILPRLFKGKALTGHPFSMSFLKWILWADVVHIFQLRNMITDFAIILGKIFKRKIFVTDLGGGQKFALSYLLPLLKWVTGILQISNYASAGCLKHLKLEGEEVFVKTIYGGVDTGIFNAGENRAAVKQPKVLFSGRLVPHKGIDHLIDAVPENSSWELIISGAAIHREYSKLLKAKAEGKRVSFFEGVDDMRLAQMYREAFVTVLPSVYKDYYGILNGAPELLGLVVLESMACGTPVIVTNVGSLPEIVRDGIDGFIVPPNDSAALRVKIEYLMDHLDLAKKMGRAGQEKILRDYTWQQTAAKCFEAYQQEVHNV